MYIYSKLSRKCYLGAVIALFSLFPILSYSADFVAGKDYEVLSEQARSLDPLSSKTVPAQDVVPVTEFFSYGCSWCYHIEPYFTGWLKKQGNAIQLTRVPVVFRPDWKLYAKAYYAIKQLKMESIIHPLLFKSIQEKTLPLNQPEIMRQFFIDHHCDANAVKNIFDDPASFNGELSEDMASLAALHIQSVPSFIVNHRYKTDLRMAENETRLLEVLDYLVKMSQKSSSNA
ncbi:MAG: thiol:disulfide interchange protein DsbA/DsbL [Legionella sp.]|nr:thiol:disulfide interchange protein DsbA/DsbL [Legionella sp.]